MHSVRFWKTLKIKENIIIKVTLSWRFCEPRTDSYEQGEFKTHLLQSRWSIRYLRYMHLSIYTLVATADAAAVLISVITTPSMILQR